MRIADIASRSLMGKRAIAFAIVATALSACAGSSSPETSEAEVTAALAPYYGKTIVWVDSYHAEYEWSANIELGLRSVLDEAGIELDVIRMDTKHVTDDDARAQVATEALAKIEQIQPDVIIATDDNAQKYLVVPHLADGPTPVVFAGVNWDASEYGYPTPTVTGMIEVDLVDRLLELLSSHANGTRVGYLSGDTSTERKVVEAYNDRFFDGAMVPKLVTSFDDFCDAFVDSQDEFDILFVGNNAGIEDWDETHFAQVAHAETTIPVGSSHTWMAPFTLLTLARDGAEQGEWAAESALRILDGTDPATIQIAENERGSLIVNLTIADRLGISLSPSVLRNAEIYDSSGT